MKKIILCSILILILLFTGCMAQPKKSNGNYSNLQPVYDEITSDWHIAKFIEKDTGNIIYLMDGAYSGAMIIIQKGDIK